MCPYLICYPLYERQGFRSCLQSHLVIFVLVAELQDISQVRSCFILSFDICSTNLSLLKGLKVPYSLEHSKHLQLQINWEFIKVFTALHTEGLSEEDAPLAAEEAASTNTFQKARVKFEQLQAKRDEASLKDNAVDEAESQLGSTEVRIASIWNSFT